MTTDRQVADCPTGTASLEALAKERTRTGDVPGFSVADVMRLCPEGSLGAVVVGNSTSYDHEAVLDAIIGTERT